MLWANLVSTGNQNSCISFTFKREMTKRDQKPTFLHRTAILSREQSTACIFRKGINIFLQV